MQDDLAAVDAVAELQPRQRRAVDPALEEPRRAIAPDSCLHRRAEVVGAGLLESLTRDRSAAARGRTPRRRPGAAACAAPPRPCCRPARGTRGCRRGCGRGGSRDRPAPDRCRSIAQLRICRSTPANASSPRCVLRVERREVLREAFAQPLLVIVPPADRLAPPLVRELVREEEVREVLERRRIVAPDERRGRQRLVERREIRRGCGRRADRFRRARAVKLGYGESPISDA